MIKKFNRRNAEALVMFVDFIHRKYPGISVKPIPRYEDEDFTFEISIPKKFSIQEVVKACHKVCIKIEDKYSFYIYPDVVYA